MRAEPRGFGTKSFPVLRLRQLRQWNVVVLDRNENSVTGDKEDGQDENEQQGAAVPTISNLGLGDGGVLDAPGNPVRGYSWTK